MAYKAINQKNSGPKFFLIMDVCVVQNRVDCVGMLGYRQRPGTKHWTAWNVTVWTYGGQIMQPCYTVCVPLALKIFFFFLFAHTGKIYLSGHAYAWPFGLFLEELGHFIRYSPCIYFNVTLFFFFVFVVCQISKALWGRRRKDAARWFLWDLWYLLAVI